MIKIYKTKLLKINEKLLSSAMKIIRQKLNRHFKIAMHMIGKLFFQFQFIFNWRILAYNIVLASVMYQHESAIEYTCPLLFNLPPLPPFVTLVVAEQALYDCKLEQNTQQMNISTMPVG